MIRRLRVAWPDGAGAARAASTRPVRLLAISDERSASLDDPRNRDELAPIDAVLGCGDLEPDYLAFLGDAFRVPLLYVRGNHDRDAGWSVGTSHIPDPLDGHLETIEGLAVGGLSWPGRDRGRAERDGTAAWWQALTTAVRSRFGRRRPDILISHIAPAGLGDAQEDDFHRGFSSYRWLCRTLQPALWLHGHTPISAAADWRTQSGSTSVINVTGGVLIEVGPPRG